MTERIAQCVGSVGDLLRHAGDVAARTHEKDSARNLVTDYDRQVQALLEQALGETFPGATFFAEEEEQHVFAKSGELFVIDPIDGTSNFVHGLGHSAVSVALLRDGEPAAGVVYDPFAQRMYTAERGQGARCNGVPCRVGTEDLAHGLCLFGTSPYDEDTHGLTCALFAAMLDAANDLRRMGAAALDLCDLARGAGAVFFEARLRPWDYAAAALILQEAGGVVTDFAGAPLSLSEPSSVLAGNPTAYRQARALLSSLAAFGAGQA